ncbi:hypothetical protein B296_00019620 [Ensete ventricosum]|uniref:Uncharacterized protein n=1 Tax=Ensete ventricosum TaxID=4639 RepID=A0A426ZTJ1_ENSVE|nr:hypothetical protein B296_00019620 [Ensete ventricosum]
MISRHSIVGPAITLTLPPCLSIDRLCPRLTWQALWAGDATSCGHLIRRPTQGHCARKQPLLGVGAALQVATPTGSTLQADAPTRGLATCKGTVD